MVEFNKEEFNDKFKKIMLTIVDSSKFFYLVEPDGNVLCLSCRQEPAWFAGNPGKWRESLAEAVELTRKGLEIDVAMLESQLATHRERLERFNNRHPPEPVDGEQ